MEHEFTWFGWISDKVTPYNEHLFSGGLVTLLLIVCAILYKKSLSSMELEVVPSKKVSFKNVVQVTVEGVVGLMEGVIGKDAKDYFPLIGTLFIYIFANNLLGAIPGFTPATSNVNTNYACSITVFLYYNYLGFKKQGFKKYMSHFMGPVWWLAPLIFSIEIISHVVRPATLSVRLLINLIGDHTVLGTFSNLVPVVVPVVFMAFGIFIAFIQAFVFTLLSTVYISLAVAHEEH